MPPPALPVPVQLNMPGSAMPLTTCRLTAPRRGPPAPARPDLAVPWAVASAQLADVVDGAFVVVGAGFGPPDGDLGQVRVEQPSPAVAVAGDLADHLDRVQRRDGRPVVGAGAVRRVAGVRRAGSRGPRGGSGNRRCGVACTECVDGRHDVARIAGQDARRRPAGRCRRSGRRGGGWCGRHRRAVRGGRDRRAGPRGLRTRAHRRTRGVLDAARGPGERHQEQPDEDRDQREGGQGEGGSPRAWLRSDR